MDQKKAGDPFSFSATTYNEISDVVNFVNATRRNTTEGPDFLKLQNGMIQIKNATANTIPEFCALTISDVVINPKTNENDFKYGPILVSGVMTTAQNANQSFCILRDQIEKDKIGRAILTGITPAQVTIKDASHQFAKPTPDSATGALESCEAGTARIVYKAGNSGLQWCILQLGAGGAGGSEYNGYFKIVNASTTDTSGKTTNRIRIVDGATYNATAGTSGKSVCKVNNAAFQVDMFSADVSASKVYCLKYTAATKANESTPAAAAKIEIVELDTMPSDDTKTAYYQIGRTIVANNTMKIQQDHTAGVAKIDWYLLCSEDEQGK